MIRVWMLFLGAGILLSNNNALWAGETSDPKATLQTRRLLKRLRGMMNGNIYIGHQNATLQGLHWRVPNHQNQTPDMVALSGIYPHVVGFDFGNFNNLDKLPYKDFLPQVKEAHKHGAIVTFSWHMFNPITGVKPGAETFKTPLLHKLLPGGSLHHHLKRGLDKIAAFAHQARDPKGRLIPILFRPFHEYNGDWFWWSNSPPNEYTKLWKYVWTYLTRTKKVHNFLYCFSPSAQYNKRNHPSYFYGYPGHTYVDVLGLDCYRNDLRVCLPRMREVVVLARHTGKVAALTETGWKHQQRATYTDHYWVNKVLAPLLGAPAARKMAYLLYWRNARLDHHYLPFPKGRKGAAHRTSSSFQAMMKHPLFRQGSNLSQLSHQPKKRNLPHGWKPRVHLLTNQGTLVELQPQSNPSSRVAWQLKTNNLQGLSKAGPTTFHSYYDPIQETQKLVVLTKRGALHHFTRRKASTPTKPHKKTWKATRLQNEEQQPPTPNTRNQSQRKTGPIRSAVSGQKLFPPRGVVWVSMGLELVFHVNTIGQLILHSKDTHKQVWKRDNLSLGLGLPKLKGQPYVYARTLDHVLTVLVEGSDGNMYSFQSRKGIRNWLVRTITEVLPQEPKPKGPFTFAIHPNHATGRLLFPGPGPSYQSLTLQPPQTTAWSYGDAPHLFPKQANIIALRSDIHANHQTCLAGQTQEGEIHALVVGKNSRRHRRTHRRQAAQRAKQRLLGVTWMGSSQCHVFLQDERGILWDLRWSGQQWKRVNISSQLPLPKKPMSLSVYPIPSPATL